MARKREMALINRHLVLDGLQPIMFDRYSGNNKEQLAVMDKCFTDEQGFLVLPALNIMSFLSAQNTESAPQRVVGRGYKEVAKAALSFVTITPRLIPFLRDGKKIPATEENLKIHFAVARVMKGKLAVPNPKERPYLETPWSLEFDLTLMPTPELNEVLLRELFEKGGLAIGLGTFRGVFGKFKVSKWERK